MSRWGEIGLAAGLILGSAAVPTAFPQEAQAAADCEYVVPPNTGWWRVEQKIGQPSAVVAAENHISPTATLEAGQVLDRCINGVNDLIDVPAPVAPATVAGTLAGCRPSVENSRQITPACRDAVAGEIFKNGYYDLRSYQLQVGLAPDRLAERVGPFTYNHAMRGEGFDVRATQPYDEYLEVDISRQIGTYYRDGRAVLISRVSTGSDRRYKYIDRISGTEGSGVARTPRGWFRVNRMEGPNYYSHKLGGESGSMGWAMFFKGGIAAHSANVPPYPASHGCVRFPKGDPRNPNDDAVKLMRNQGFGMRDRVWVHN